MTVWSIKGAQDYLTPDLQHSRLPMVTEDLSQQLISAVERSGRCGFFSEKFG